MGPIGLIPFERSGGGWEDTDRGADMDPIDGTDGIERRIGMGVVGAMAASTVTVDKGIVGALATRGDVHIERGICGPVAAMGGVQVRNGFCGPVAAIGGAHLERMATQSVVAVGRVELHERANVGVVLSPFVTIQEGARVLINTPQALALGAVAGVVAGLILRTKRREGSATT